jgi:hypothetical protein
MVKPKAVSKIKRVEDTKSERKMPPGKQQFGIIIRKDVHKKAKHLAADMELAISDIYANGVLAIEDQYRSGDDRQQIEMLARELVDGVPKEEIGYLKGVAAFLRSKPEPRELEMLRVILGKFVAPGSVSDPVSRKFQQ